MKKFCLLLAFCLLIAFVPVNAFAVQSKESVINTIRFDDGSYITIETDTIESRSGYSASGRRLYTYYSSTDVKKWEATLFATFVYNGTTCSCASSDIQVNILDSAWYIVSKEPGRNGNVATGELTMGYKFLGITTTKKTIEMSITCDANGNLS